MMNPRYVAANLLDKTFRGGSFSNIQLGSGLEKSDLDAQGKKLCTAIYYGVIQRKITLDHIIKKYSSRPPDKIDSIVMNILRCGLYQLLFMDSIPDSAAVNESVSLAKQFRKTSAGGMINAVLRHFIRDGKRIEIPDGIEGLSVKFSVPVPLIESLVNDYGEGTAVLFLESSLESENVTFIRRNQLKCDDGTLRGLLEDYGISGDDCCYTVRGDVTDTEAFRSGFFHVQGLASQICCAALNPEGAESVLDLCAAPGGKTFTIAEMMNGRGQVFAFDLHEKRVKLIRDGAERLGLRNVTADVGDASEFNESLPKFQKILCDVPCSGLGVIRSKPEIKYKNFSDFGGLPEIQYRIAENALKYLAVGGEMVYSTCTVRKAENDDVISRLLKNHPEIELCELPEIFGRSYPNPVTLFPSAVVGCDGFFIAKLRKKY